MRKNSGRASAGISMAFFQKPRLRPPSRAPPMPVQVSQRGMPKMGENNGEKPTKTKPEKSRRRGASRVTFRDPSGGVDVNFEDRRGEILVTITPFKKAKHFIAGAATGLAAAITGHMTFEAIAPWLQMLILKASGG